MFFALYPGLAQGFVWSKRLFFFLVGVTFGTSAYLTDSTLPAIPIHIAAIWCFQLHLAAGRPSRAALATRP